MRKIEKIELAKVQMSNLADRGRKLKNKNKLPDFPLISDINKSLIPLAIRNPNNFKNKTKSSNRDKKRLELVRFMFSKYPTPKILDQAWSRSGINIHSEHDNFFEAKKWYICAGTGGSLHKDFFKGFMTKKETSEFVKCNKNLTINEAIYYVTALCAGANEGIAFRIAKSKLGVKPKDSVFWRDNARFFATNSPESIEKINDIVDFLEAKFREDTNFKLFGQGYTLKTIEKRVEDWHYELRRMKELSKYSWEGCSLENKEYVKKDQYGNDVIWKLKQILTGKELASEGSAMHHCVYSYKEKCSKGDCSIWSLTVLDKNYNMKRAATIELNGKRIVQARGFANRKLKKDEMSVVQTWARDEGLSYL